MLANETLVPVEAGWCWELPLKAGPPSLHTTFRQMLRQRHNHSGGARRALLVPKPGCASQAPCEERAPCKRETSLVVQWLRFCSPDAEGLGLTLVRELDPTLPQ